MRPAYQQSEGLYSRAAVRVRRDQRVKHRLEFQFGFGELPLWCRAINNTGTGVPPGGMCFSEVE